MRASFLLIGVFTLSAGVIAANSGLVQNEYAFVQAVADHGVKDGFLAYLDPEAIGFSPTPKKSYADYQARKPSAVKLTWYPSDALLAASGDFGFTTGPWTFVYDHNGSPQTAQGDFVTLWHRVKDGRWLALLDAGIDHDSPASDPVAMPRDAATPQLPRGTSSADRKRVRAELLQADGSFTESAATDGLRAAYGRFGADSLRLLQENEQPAVGKAAALAASPEDKALLQWIPQDAAVASSGDLGYTYGVSYKTGDSARSFPQASYLHIWRRDGGGLKLVLALESPIPPPKPQAG